jgi:predicted lactoylglutathione lyase
MPTQDTPPALAQLNLAVTDMAAAVAFYRCIGFEIDDTRPFSIRHNAIRMTNGFLLELDSMEFARRRNRAWRGQACPGRIVIGFTVSSRKQVDDLYAAIVGAGYPGQQPPHDAFWGARYAVVEDPEGNHVGIMSPIERAMRSAPPH